MTARRWMSLTDIPSAAPSPYLISGPRSHCRRVTKALGATGRIIPVGGWAEAALEMNGRLLLPNPRYFRVAHDSGGSRPFRIVHGECLPGLDFACWASRSNFNNWPICERVTVGSLLSSVTGIVGALSGHSV